MSETIDELGGAPSKTYADGRLLLAIEDGVAVLTFNNPTRMNALAVEIAEGMVEALGALAADDAVKVVVLTGAGGRSFISGADISQFSKTRTTGDLALEAGKANWRRQEALINFPKPTIAAIRGYCIGAGVMTAANADIRLATEDSVFAVPAARLGLSYGFNGLERLVTLVGPARAKLIMFTGDRLKADEAYAIGLIDRVVPRDAFKAEALGLARRIASNAPLSVKASKLTIAQTQLPPEARDVEMMRALDLACGSSEDFREGRTAFMEKRPPVFRGR